MVGLIVASACVTEQVQSVSQSVHVKIRFVQTDSRKNKHDTIVQTFKSCLLKSVFQRTD